MSKANKQKKCNKTKCKHYDKGIKDCVVVSYLDWIFVLIDFKEVTK